ncbi:TonB-dependent receptor [Granulicella arctica]|uniref:TonB-dependent receptor n=1 Tax=Granulicella arctica TaxID=940613 RepID=UPI0021E05861|nr:TonB-dependent receptor [Granulicella arctica]
MISTFRRAARCFTLRAIAPLMFLSPVAAHAVIVRGTVTDPLGAAIPFAKVELVQGKRVVAIALSGPEGSFEILTDAHGRFLLLTSAQSFAVGIGQDFYGGRTETISRNVVLSVASITERVTVTATGAPTPLEQVSSAVTLIPTRDLETRVGLLDDLRQSPGTVVVQTGQLGGATSLFVRGGNSDANKVLIDGIPAEDVGGGFDYGTVSTTGFGSTTNLGTAIELYRGPDSVLYGSNAAASALSLTTTRGTSLRPVFNYSGDAGNFHSYRNEGTLSGAFRKLDYFGGFSRFDTSNSIPLERFHATTSVVNIGADLIANTQMRFTLRNTDSASGLPNAHDFYGVSQDGKQSDQDLYSGVTVENRLLGNLHTLVSYGIARKREQAAYYGNPGTLVTIPSAFGPFQAYVGDLVTFTGANGYSATGQAQFFSTDRDQDSNRDELYYQTDYTFPHRIFALFGFRYENERGVFNAPAFGESNSIKRTNFEYTLQFQGDIKNRLFYSAGGAIEKNHLYGVAGTPRIGLAYFPVRPGSKWFRGTKLRANVATGVQEPSLATEFSSLYRELLQAGDTADIAKFSIAPLGPERSRTLDIGVDQNIRGEKLIFKGGYFHNQFSHQLEGVAPGDLQTYFGVTISPANDAAFLGAELNSLAFRAQGIETELQYQPFNRLFLRGGYTYLDSVVSQSFSGDAAAARQGVPEMNPNLPGIAIGSTSPLIGARPFRRPPHTGFFAVQYSGSSFTWAFKGALASRADDSTFLGALDTTLNGNTLLLPNRNLDYGFAKLDTSFTYRATSHVSVFSQLDNLLSQQHIGPIGYPSLPFTFRTGLKIRLGGE